MITVVKQDTSETINDISDIHTIAKKTVYCALDKDGKLQELTSFEGYDDILEEQSDANKSDNIDIISVHSKDDLDITYLTGAHYNIYPSGRKGAKVSIQLIKTFCLLKKFLNNKFMYIKYFNRGQQNSIMYINNNQLIISKVYSCKQHIEYLDQSEIALNKDALIKTLVVLEKKFPITEPCFEDSNDTNKLLIDIIPSLASIKTSLKNKNDMQQTKDIDSSDKDLSNLVNSM